MGGDSSATIIWACLYFLRTKTISQVFDSTTTSAETHELHVSLDEKQRKLTEYQTNIANIEKYASNLQTFIAVKQIETNIFNQFFNQMLDLIEPS
jgi:hypothetical protein